MFNWSDILCNPSWSNKSLRWTNARTPYKKHLKKKRDVHAKRGFNVFALKIGSIETLAL